MDENKTNNEKEETIFGNIEKYSKNHISSKGAKANVVRFVMILKEEEDQKENQEDTDKERNTNVEED
ncbi:hypothetical protein [Bacillus phage SPbetaL1]|nr:hypothetical protein [Bacillus phage SPbetaL1]